MRGPLIKMMQRRYFLCASTLLLTGVILSVPAVVALAQQMSDKPKVKLSQVRIKVWELVENLSRDAKEHGVVVSEEQKIEMVDDIVSKMEAQGAYAFIVNLPAFSVPLS
jgi:hypothetical protein